MISVLQFDLFALRQWAGDNLGRIFVFLILVNAYAFALFAIDKNRAVAGGYLAKKRIPENTLLFLAFVGGSPALVLGQKLLNHKTRKQPFASLLIAIIVVQIVMVVLFSELEWVLANVPTQWNW